MTKIVSLSVHRNTRAKRQDRATSKELITDAKELACRKDIHGYAIVTWNRDQDAVSAWSVSEVMPTSILPEFVKGAIQRKVSMLDNE